MEDASELEQLLERYDASDDLDYAQTAWLELRRKHGAANVHPAALRTRAKQRRCDQYRRQRREASNQQHYLDAIPSLKMVDQEILERECKAILHAVVAILPKHMALVIQRHYFDGESLRQVAVAMGLPLATVKSWKCRAIRLLGESPRLASLMA